MFFNTNVSITDITSWANRQIALVVPVAKNGIDIEIRPHKTQRSNQQNRFLMAIMVALVRFYHETGYIPDGLSKYVMKPSILKEYWKGRYGIEHTKNLDTATFGRFIDFIQLTLVEETSGEWEVLEPDSAYIKSLINDGGF